MTPRSIFTIVILAITLLIGGSLGYFIGHHGALSAEKALNNDVTIGKVQDAEHDQLVEQLRTQLTQISSDYQALAAKDKATQAASDSQWQQTIAQKNLAIELATKNSTQAQVQVNTLKAALFLAMTPEEKAALQQQLDGAQQQLYVLQSRTDGLKCLSIPIPQEYLEAANSASSGSVATQASGVSK